MSVNMKISGILLLTSFLTGTVLLNSCIKDPTLPVLKTEPVTEITINSVRISADITDDGGADVTERGFCWGTASNPTILDEIVPAGKGTGEFAGNIEGLEPNTLYYARAYAENSVGIAYGNEIAFVTSTAAPAVTTTQVSGITASTAVCGGTVTYDGGGSVTGTGVCWSTTPEPDLSDFFTSEVTGSASFSSQLTNLAPTTTYYVRAYVKNSAWTVYGEEIAFTTKLADIEGNLYNTVIIGTQVWMAENLRATKFNDNTPIPNITDNTEWLNLTGAAYCWYNNDIQYKSTMGALYSWYTIEAGAICPAGWHVPSDDEYGTLEIFLGMNPDSVNVWGWRGTNQGAQLKSTTGWDDGGNGINTSGFTGLPGGYRYAAQGVFYKLGTVTYWWSASEFDANEGWYRRLDSSSSDVYRASTSKKGGKYIRCVKN